MSKHSSRLTLLTLSSALLLAACTQGPSTTPSPTGETYPVSPTPTTGTATLSADLVYSNRGTPVPDSTAYLFKAGERGAAVAKASTDAKGYVEFSRLPAGTYDLVFVKAGFSGSEIDGVIARSDKNSRLKVAQFSGGDPGADTSTPRLKIETVDTLKADGTVNAYKVLAPGTAFNDTVTVRASTEKKGEAPRVMRYVLMSLVTLDDGGNWADVRPGTGLYTSDPGYVTPGVGDQGQDTGLVSLDPTGLEGDVYLQVVGLDFNYNRVAYLIPITIKRSGAAATVTAPTNLRAIAYTLSERINYLYSATNPDTISPDATSPDTTSPDAPTSGTNLWVTTSWDMPASMTGLRGFRVLRATAAAGPYAQVAFAGDKQCNATTKRCTVNDNTATLNTDQDYVYKVVAVGQNTAESAAVATHTLPTFRPQLLAPTKDSHDVGLLPTYSIKNNVFSIGATGAQYELRVADTRLSQSFAYAARRLILRKGFDAAGKSETQVLSNLETTNLYPVYRDSNKPEDNLVTYDAATDALNVPHQFENVALGLPVVPLQANRVYSWYINKGYAYRVLDPSKPASATNYVTAYSVYSDPDTTPIVPGGIRQEYTEVNDFTTRN